MASFRHIALVVPDLQAAEAYYQSLFGMQLIGREAEREDGHWHTLPLDKGWDDARVAGIELDMTALRKGEMVLALFAGEAPQGQVFAVGLGLPRQQIGEIRSRLGLGEAEPDEADQLEFRDPYGITWQLSTPGIEFRTSGELAGRWLDL